MILPSNPRQIWQPNACAHWTTVAIVPFSRIYFFLYNILCFFLVLTHFLAQFSINKKNCTFAWLASCALCTPRHCCSLLRLPIDDIRDAFYFAIERIVCAVRARIQCPSLAMQSTVCLHAIHAIFLCTSFRLFRQYQSTKWIRRRGRERRTVESKEESKNNNKKTDCISAICSYYSNACIPLDAFIFL